MGAPADPAADRLAVAAGVGRARQHGVLGRDPALARSLAPARDAGGEGRDAQHAGPPELDEDAALAVLDPAAGDGDRAQLRRRAAVDAGVGGHGRGVGHEARPYPRGRIRPRGRAPAMPGGPDRRRPRRRRPRRAPRTPRAVRASRRGVRHPHAARPHPPRARSGAGRGGLSRPSTYVASASSTSEPLARSSNASQAAVSPE